MRVLENGVPVNTEGAIILFKSCHGAN